MSKSTDEISLKDLLLSIQFFFKHLLSKWKVILIIALIGSLLGFFYVFSKVPTYTGKITFVLVSDAKSGGLSSLAGQFGIDVGGGGAVLLKGKILLSY